MRWMLDSEAVARHIIGVLTTKELLNLLRERGIRNVDAARVLNLPDSRIAEIYSGKRSLKLDEAAKLVAAFDLRDAPLVPDEVVAVLIKYVASALGKPIGDGDAHLEALKADLIAFARFQCDPATKASAAAAEGFFRGLSARKGV